MTDPVTGRPQPAPDQALLDRLSAALRPPPLAPTSASVTALRACVERKWRPTGSSRVIGQLAAWARRLQRTGAVVVALAGVAVGGTGVALAAKGSIPRPVQDTLRGIQYTLRDLGIPVPSSVAYHNGGNPARPPVEVSPQGARQPAPTTSAPRPAQPATTAAASQIVAATTMFTRRLTSASTVTALPPVPAPATTGTGAPLAGSAPSMAPTTRATAHRTHGVENCARPAAPRDTLTAVGVHRHGAHISAGHLGEPLRPASKTSSEATCHLATEAVVRSPVPVTPSVVRHSDPW
jgi:hypothetical protein